METNSGKTILVVEDDTVLSNALRDACSSAGYEVLVAPDGEEGLKAALENKPNVILLDILMPKMDGLTMLKKLNAQQVGFKSHVFLFTNLSETDKIAEALAEGAAGYFVKSQTSLDEILTKIKEVLEKGSANQK